MNERKQGPLGHLPAAVEARMARIEFKGNGRHPLIETARPMVAFR